MLQLESYCGPGSVAYICLFVCNTQECKKYLIQCVGILTKQTLSLQYQDMNCYLDHWILWYKMIMGFEVA